MPYLRAASTAEATNLINFIRGDQIAGYRNRQLTVSGSLRVWKLGDIINSTPTIVGAPRERYDVIYGDGSYTDFFVKYKDRRQVAYVGANDGMLHAFNVGFYHRGDDASTGGVVEHGWFTRTPTDNSSGPLLGDELWGFVPYHLLPHLQWLTKTDYGHSYYVDLKPKVTDARIFTPDTDHPNGWGTILIGGLRLGGSCGVCPNSHAPPMTVNIGGTNRTFYTAYFVLDITNPEVDPKLLWVFSDSSLGLSTSYPAVVRVNPSASAKTDNTNARWFMVVGSGPTGYDGYSLQIGQFFAVDLKNGPLGPGSLTSFPTGNSSPACSTGGGSDACSVLGDLIGVDKDLDYRADAVYGGNVVCNATSGSAPWRCSGDGSSTWAGALYRLTTGSTAPFGINTDPLTWGISSGGSRVPTVLLGTFTCTPTPCTGPTTVGPVLSAPTVAADGSQNVWVFFGTGRLLSATDKSNADTQHFFGVKDPVVQSACTQTTVADCQQNDLVNVSGATVCVVCTSGTDQVTGVAGVTTLEGTATSTLQGLVASKHGWYTTLPTLGERDLASPTLLGGIVFFPTYVPTVTDVCTGSGSSSLYALFYLTGSAYRESVIGTDVVAGNTVVKRSLTLGIGMASQVSVHIGALATDSATGVTGRAKACTQSSSGALTCIRTNPALSVWSRYLSWNLQND
jgi:type IV pilus assembly protein PilY1